MKNQEIYKKSTFEKTENIKQSKEKIENSTQESEPIRLPDINQEILKKEENIQNTRIEIDDIRNRLRLAPTDETPPSIKIQQESIAKLDQEKYEENKRFESNLKTTLADISTKSKTMIDALYERQQNKLTPLQSNEDFQKMVSSIRNLKNFESKIDIDFVSKIIDNVKQLNQSLDNIKIQRSSIMREDTQNLEKLRYGAKSFSVSVDGNRRGIPIEMKDKQMEEKSRELRISLQKLTEQSEKLWLFASKLKESVR
jgi:hypothetical protein